MSSASFQITEKKIQKIREDLSNHPLYEIIDCIHQCLDERKENDLGDLGAWGFTLSNVKNTYERRKETMSQYAESWLWLGELRSQIRLVCHADPNTTEEDEIYFREHPEQIPIAFESFIGAVIFSLIGISSLN